MQIVYNPSTADEIENCYKTDVGITWASNWQYTALVPTEHQWQFQGKLK